MTWSRSCVLSQPGLPVEIGPSDLSTRLKKVLAVVFYRLWNMFETHVFWLS